MFEIILLSCKYLFENGIENKAFVQTVTIFFAGIKCEN